MAEHHAVCSVYQLLGKGSLKNIAASCSPDRE